MDETTLLGENGHWFAVNLHAARLQSGLTQAELAARVEKDIGRPYSQQTHSKIESGTQDPALSVALALARHTGTDLFTLTRAPEAASVALEIARLTRETREAHQAAEDAAARFLRCRDDLLRMWAVREPPEEKDAVVDAGPAAIEALGLQLTGEPDKED